jgi:hypothetical protein
MYSYILRIIFSGMQVIKITNNTKIGKYITFWESWRHCGKPLTKSYHSDA